ncbi:hypothetical protein MKW98_002570 [Papaver atlanticum]|uniref:Uncharacterized protein n=1 Tax=Papaver atlanticum TaxID=357466 RepID=A0AAD4SD19_9MAGN|nr:hypothetical protein MKW98_002570 [Papaver atlanticum]
MSLLNIHLNNLGYGEVTGALNFGKLLDLSRSKETCLYTLRCNSFVWRRVDGDASSSGLWNGSKVAFLGHSKSLCQLKAILAAPAQHMHRVSLMHWLTFGHS